MARPKKTPKAKTATPRPKRAVKAAPKAKAKPAAAVDHAALARTGEVDALFGLIDDTGNARLAYKWLCAASDFGHEAADDRIAEVLEHGSLRDDDEGYEVAAAHWELACAYLEGTEGLPLDIALAKKHLQQAFDQHDLASINAGTNESYSPATLLLKLTGDAWTTLQTALVNVPGDNLDDVE